MNRAASEGAGLLAESDTEEAGGGSSKWDKVRVVQKVRPKSLLHSLSETRLLPEVAAASHTKYDPESWLPTISASFETVGSFVLMPLAIITLQTAFMTYVSRAYASPPWWINLPPFAHTVLGGALSFLMVFRTNTAYSRWWEARLMWGQITVTCRSIGSNASAMLVKPEPMISLLIAFPVVVKNHLRGERTQPAELAAAESASTNEPSQSNLSVLASAASPPNSTIEAMAMTIRAGLKMDDGLGASAYMHLSDDLRALTQAATACERIKSSPMPLGYVSALRFFLLFWLFTLPLTLIGPYGGAAIPAVAVIAFCFLNLENVAMEIEQPFGTVRSLGSAFPTL
jgi:putative membrane protein